MKCPKAKQRRGRHVVDNQDDSYIYTCSCGCEFECWSEGNYYILNEHNCEADDVEVQWVRHVRKEGNVEAIGNFVFLVFGIICMAAVGALAIKLLMLQ